MINREDAGGSHPEEAQPDPRPAWLGMKGSCSPLSSRLAGAAGGIEGKCLCGRAGLKVLIGLALLSALSEADVQVNLPPTAATPEQGFNEAPA